MTQVNDTCALMPRFLAQLRHALQDHPKTEGGVAVTQCPGVADVMGGIGEDSGSLVITAALAQRYLCAAWRIAGSHIKLRFLSENGEGDPLDFQVPVEGLIGTDPETIAAACAQANAQWAASSCLVLATAIGESLLPRFDGGLFVLVQTDFAENVEFGRYSVQAAATIDAACSALDQPAERLVQSRVCATAVGPLTGHDGVRTAMTSLTAPSDGSLLQLRFQPQAICQPFHLPAGIIILAARTQLTRPTTNRRLVDTRACMEMGRRIIQDLQRQDGLRADESSCRLSAITPAEYVERYRDRLPPKISGRAFADKFGELRGLNGDLDPAATYKVRSRAEHHIYENRRVHEFATHLVRARRSNAIDAIVQAGELMYASHWSHSQRCGIGGVEPDQLVTSIRKHGPKAGLFGAKVTAGGEGGEMVVLMRDTEQAHAALADAVAQAEAAANKPILMLRGSLGGADHFVAPALDEPLDVIPTTA